LSALAVSNETVVGFDGTPTMPAWYSLDGGQTWSNAVFQLPFSFVATDAATREGAFLAVGRACCGLPSRVSGQIVSSPDGITWSPAMDYALAAPTEAIVATPWGWIALGGQTYLSSDGVTWRLGPPLPGYEPRDHALNGHVIPFRLAAASIGDIVVAMTPSTVWYASVTELEPGKWPDQAPRAELPEVGVGFDYRLFTHCGPTNGSLQFGFRSWVPDLPDGAFPRSYDSYYEQGTLTFVTDDELQFKGRAGEVVSYHPTADPPASFPCA
jgi:hypothetical protein